MDNIIAGAVMRAPHADAVANHRFAAGHMVRLSRAIPLRNAAAGNYEVLAQLPERDGDLQYRIKSETPDDGTEMQREPRFLYRGFK